MAGLDIEMAYPLGWPAGRERTEDRKMARFNDSRGELTFMRARQRLLKQVTALTRPVQPWRTTLLLLSTNIRFTASGARDKNFLREPLDPGATFFFDLDRQPYVLACDRWNTVASNIAAIAAHIDALRGQERWGVADLRQAFAGHVALAAPQAATARAWWKVLGLPSADVSINDVEVMFRRLAAIHHPDKGGSAERMAELNRARDEAKESVG